jgi:hypothetical protein
LGRKLICDLSESLESFRLWAIKRNKNRIIINPAFALFNLKYIRVVMGLRVSSERRTLLPLLSAEGQPELLTVLGRLGNHSKKVKLRCKSRMYWRSSYRNEENVFKNKSLPLSNGILTTDLVWYSRWALVQPSKQAVTALIALPYASAHAVMIRINWFSQ